MNIFVNVGEHHDKRNSAFICDLGVPKTALPTFV